jgi:hypothetical protein
MKSVKWLSNVDDRVESRVHTKFAEPLRCQKAVGFYSLDELQKIQKRLDEIQHRLTTEITDYSLGVVHDLLDEDAPQIIRTILFRCGIMEYHLSIDGTGIVRSLDSRMPTRLFDQIIDTLNACYDDLHLSPKSDGSP